MTRFITRLPAAVFAAALLSTVAIATASAQGRTSNSAEGTVNAATGQVATTRVGPSAPHRARHAHAARKHKARHARAHRAAPAPVVR